MTPLERIEPEVADEVADELDVQMREMTPLEPEVADEVADEFDKFDNQCPATGRATLPALSSESLGQVTWTRIRIGCNA